MLPAPRRDSNRKIIRRVSSFPGTSRIDFIRWAFRTRGSVFPYAMRMTIPCTVATYICVFVKNFQESEYPDNDLVASILRSLKVFVTLFHLENVVYQGFTSLLGFLVIFLTSHSYYRYWDGATLTHLMMGNWWDACSSLLAFCKMSAASEADVERFRQTIVRLYSMLHALALADLQDHDFEDIESHPGFALELIDAHGIDPASLCAIKRQQFKIEMVFHWIQSLIVKNVGSGVLNVPPPILSRAFQEMAQGMVNFHEAQKISKLPFPFPYTQATLVLLLLHWLVTPMIACNWSGSFVATGFFSSVQVCVLWCLYGVARELENPFGQDANDLDVVQMQQDMNLRLLLLVHPDTKHSPDLTVAQSALVSQRGFVDFEMASFNTVWENMSPWKTDDVPDDGMRSVTSMLVSPTESRPGQRYGRSSQMMSQQSNYFGDDAGVETSMPQAPSIPAEHPSPPLHAEVLVSHQWAPKAIVTDKASAIPITPRLAEVPREDSARLLASFSIRPGHDAMFCSGQSSGYQGIQGQTIIDQSHADRRGDGLRCVIDA